MIKHIVLSALIASVSLSPLPCAAATQVQDGDAALAKAGKDGIIIFTYAEGWDKFSKQLALKYMASDAIKRASGDAALLALPCYDGSPADQAEKLASTLGELKVPTVLSYPAIIILDAKGRHASTIQGRDMTAYTTESVAKILAARLKDLKQQNELIEQAEKASGPAKAKLLGKAATMPNMVAPPDHLKQIKEADPEDVSGVTRGLTTDEWKISAQVAELKSIEEMIPFVEEVLADELYSTKVKQTAILRLIAQWRTMGTRDQLGLMRKYAQKVIDLDDSNYHANSAKYMQEYWLRAFTVKSGWFQGMIPADDREVRMEGDIPIKEVGNYTITIKHTGGRYALTVTGMYLYDGDKLIAKDEHVGVAGDRPKATVYSFNVTSKLSKPGLGFKFDQGNKSASEGQFIIEKVQ